MQPWRIVGLFLLSLGLWVSSSNGRHYTEAWSTPEIIPSRMVGVHLDEEVHVARVRFGSKQLELRLVLDFSSRGVIVSSVPQLPSGGTVVSSHPSMWSATYSAAAGGSDIIWISGHGHRVPTTFDPTAAGTYGCAACNGVLGVGAGSPLWLIYHHVTFSAGTIALDRKRPPVKGKDRPRVACDPLVPHMCVTRGQAYGAWYDVEFSFQSPYTFVPLAVYNAYVGSKSVSSTPLSDWDHLVIRFRAADAPVDPRQPKLRIAPSSLIGASRRNEVSTLLLRPNPNPADTRIILGRSVWRSLMVHRNFATGTAAIQTYDSTKRYPIWLQILAVLVALVVVRWWTTRDALFYESKGMVGRGTPETVARFHTKIYPGEWGVYPDRLLIELAVIPAAIVLLYVPPFSTTVSFEVTFHAYLQVITYASVLWIAGMWVLRLIGSADVMGSFTVRIYPRSPPQQAQYQQDTVQSKQRLTALDQAAYDSNSWRQRVQVGLVLTPGGPPPPTFIAGRDGRSSQLAFVIYRMALIRQATVDVLFFVILILFAAFTRSDTLGQTMVAIVAAVLAGVVLYHLATGVVHLVRFQYHNPLGVSIYEDLWTLWIIYSVALVLATAAIISVFVLVPFLQLHVTSVNTGVYLMGIAVVFLFGAWLAYLAADNSATYMQEWTDRQRELMQEQLSGPAPAPNPVAEPTKEAEEEEPASPPPSPEPVKAT